MGLDMYLSARKFQRTNWSAPETDMHMDGKRVEEISLRLGYWRKHPDLHGYIVQKFAEGRDECQDIDLCAEDIEAIIADIKKDNLAHGTQGFFFGRSYQPGEKDEYGSYEEQKKTDIAVFKDALAWLKSEKEANEQDARKWWHNVVYRASW